MPRKKKEIQEPKMLEIAEIAKIELNHEQEKCRKLEKKVMELEIKNKAYQLEITRKDIELLKNMLDRNEVKHNAERLKYKMFYKELRDKYSLEDGFGFNPETGELKP